MGPVKKSADSNQPAATIVDGHGGRPASTNTVMIRQALQLAAEAVRARQMRQPYPMSEGGASTAPSPSPSPLGCSSPSSASCSMSTGDPAVQLIALLAQALGEEGAYWVDLRRQAEVDSLAEFFRYCAGKGYTALKTQHLLRWLQAYQALVEGRRDSDDTVAETLLPAAQAATAAAAAAAAAEAAAEEDVGRKPRRGSVSHTRGTPDPHTARKATGAASTEKRRSTSTDLPPAAGQGVPEGTGLPAPPPQRIPFAVALRDALVTFVQEEVELGWKWDQVPRTAAPSVPANGPSLASGSAKKRASRNERARQQQQQQQELEEQQRRMAVAAAMPPENIYLRADEAGEFVETFVARGLVQHAALFEYVAAHDSQAGVPGPAPQFSLCLEQPMHVPELTQAAAFAGDGPIAAALEEMNRPPVAPTTGGPKGGGARGSAAPSSRGGTASVAGSESAAVVAEPPPPTPFEALAAEREKELGVLAQLHSAAVAAAEHRARVEQTQRDMELVFGDREGTTKAVVDVYDSLEREVQERQSRILRRITALEVVLGVRPDTGSAGDASRPPSAPAPKPGSAKKPAGKRK